MNQFIHLYHAPQPGHPLFVLLHGMGGSERDLLPLARELDPQAGYLALQGQVLERGRIRRFFKRIGQGVFDQDDLHQRTIQLNAFLQEASVYYGFSISEVILVGYSNGANFAASLLFRFPFAGKGALLLHPMVPTRGLERPDLQGLPVMINAGTQDPICPPQESEELVTLLKAQHANVTLNWSNGGHSLTTAAVLSAKNWLNTLSKLNNHPQG